MKNWPLIADGNSIRFIYQIDLGNGNVSEETVLNNDDLKEYKIEKRGVNSSFFRSGSWFTDATNTGTPENNAVTISGIQQTDGSIELTVEFSGSVSSTVGID